MPTELTSDKIFEKKVKKFSKIGKDLKSSKFNSAYFLTAIVKISFLEGRISLCGKCGLSQNFHIKKLGETLVYWKFLFALTRSLCRQNLYLFHK